MIKVIYYIFIQLRKNKKRSYCRGHNFLLPFPRLARLHFFKKSVTKRRKSPRIVTFGSMLPPSHNDFVAPLRIAPLETPFFESDIKLDEVFFEMENALIKNAIPL